jgi:small conductance mechanosensitive channel
MLEEKIISFLIDLGIALVVLAVGIIIIKYLKDILTVIISKTKMDNTLKPFIVSIIGVVLKIILAMVVISIVGIDTSSLIALLASAGFAIGLAFQGSLSNFAGGILLLTVRPFKIGDYVEVNGLAGTVEAIQILYTSLVTPDNKVVFIPNGALANSNMTNYSAKELRRVDLKFSVDYNSDAELVLETLEKVSTKHPLVKKDPLPLIRMFEHGDSSLIYVVRVWTDTANYWPVYYDITEKVKEQFDKKGISIPYPQMDINIKSGDVK